VCSIENLKSEIENVYGVSYAKSKTTSFKSTNRQAPGA